MAYKIKRKKKKYIKSYVDTLDLPVIKRKGFFKFGSLDRKYWNLSKRKKKKVS